MTKAMNLETLTRLSEELEQLTRMTRQSVVSLSGADTRASGFVWRPGWIVTADEALGESGDLTVGLSDGTSLAATVRGRDATTDVALLQLETDLGQQAAAAGEAVVGGLVQVVGAVGGDPIACFGTVGRAGGTWRSMRGGEIDARIELSLRLPGPAEGGLAVRADGRVLGMAVYGPRHRVLVIPWSTIDRIAARLMQHGHIPRGWLGVGLNPVRLATGDGRGLMIVHLEPDGPAARAGLLMGDIVTTVDRAGIGESGRLQTVLGPDSVGKVLTLGVVRAGSDTSVEVTIGERPVD